jgi:hypothetical protein
MQHWPNWSTARPGGPTPLSDGLRFKQVLALMTASCRRVGRDRGGNQGTRCEIGSWRRVTSGPYPIVAACAALSATLEKSPQAAPLPTSIRTAPYARPSGVTAGTFDKLLLNGFKRGGWPGMTKRPQSAVPLRSSRPTPHAGRFAGSPGAGNITSIAPLDAFYELVCTQPASSRSNSIRSWIPCSA